MGGDSGDFAVWGPAYSTEGNVACLKGEGYSPKLLFSFGHGGDGLGSSVAIYQLVGVTPGCTSFLHGISGLFHSTTESIYSQSLRKPGTDIVYV